MNSLLIQQIRENIILHVKEHPEVLEGGSIDKNNGLVVVMGMHRTGSTLLQNLLAQDPKSRTLHVWEMQESIPPITSIEEHKDPKRLKNMEEKLADLHSLCPKYLENFRKLHYFAAHAPEEDCIILFGLNAFWYISYLLSDIDPELPSILRERSPYICRYLHLFLKTLNYYCPPESHWVIKNPDHSQYLESFLGEFPNANIIVTHRDPKKVVPSWTKLTLFSNHLFLLDDFAQFDSLKVNIIFFFNYFNISLIK